LIEGFELVVSDIFGFSDFRKIDIFMKRGLLMFFKIGFDKEWFNLKSVGVFPAIKLKFLSERI
jgi:hypothetical protein